MLTEIEKKLYGSVEGKSFYFSPGGQRLSNLAKSNSQQSDNCYIGKSLHGSDQLYQAEKFATRAFAFRLACVKNDIDVIENKVRERLSAIQTKHNIKNSSRITESRKLAVSHLGSDGCYSISESDVKHEVSFIISLIRSIYENNVSKVS